MRQQREKTKTRDLLVVHRNRTLFQCFFLFFFGCFCCLCDPLLCKRIYASLFSFIPLLMLVCCCSLVADSFCWPFILFSLAETFVSVNDFSEGFRAVKLIHAWIDLSRFFTYWTHVKIRLNTPLIWYIQPTKIGKESNSFECTDLRFIYLLNLHLDVAALNLRHAEEKCDTFIQGILFTVHLKVSEPLK